MYEQRIIINGPDYPIHSVLSFPDGFGPFPCVLMLHGTFSNSEEVGNAFATLAHALAENGIASVRFDFVGAAHSTVDYVNYSISSCMSDCESVLSYMKKEPEFDMDHMTILGFSQGAALALYYAGLHPKFRNVVSWSGFIDLSYMVDPKEYEEAKQNGFAHLDIDWCGPLDRGLRWYEECMNLPSAETFNDINVPILAVAGSDDTVVSPDHSEEIIAKAKDRNSELFIVEGADHVFNLLNGETGPLDKVIHKTIEFITKNNG